MLLGGRAIAHAIDGSVWQAYRNGQRITKSADLRIGPNSVDVTLAATLLLPRQPEHGVVDLASINVNDHPSYDKVEMGDAGYVLEPQACALGSTQERFACDAPLANVCPRPHEKHCFVQHYEGRSTIGRVFLASHVTAAFGDYGFAGYWTLELCNLSRYPIRIRHGMRIGQVFFTEVTRPAYYRGAYPQEDAAIPVMPRLGPDRV